MITCIVQARMGSTRLPGKVIKEILGIPMVAILLKRLKKSRYIDNLILATSDKNEDDILCKIVSDYGFEVFRGDEENVLKRYVDCVKHYGGDTIIRITGDCPLNDPTIVDNVITHYMMYDYDYIRLQAGESFPRGFDVEVFSKDALFKIVNVAKEKKYTEHVTSYFYTHPEEFKVSEVKGHSYYVKDYRLCVDTIEDFEIVKRIFENFNDIYVSSIDTMKFLDKNPEITTINKEIIQKKIDEV